MKTLEDPFLGIPIDLVMDILFRVPARTIASCRSVSKQWRSIIGRRDFKELFLTIPQNTARKSTLVLTRYHANHYSLREFSASFGSPLGGFICRQDTGRHVGIVICNPATGESLSLPQVESESINTWVSPVLGYDPIDKQFKVLCIQHDSVPSRPEDHQIMTLENGKHLWRTVQGKPHYPRSNEICIDGVLYYTAVVELGLKVSMIVCFDVRFENFSFISINDDDEATVLTSRCQLINYKGKLGALQFKETLPARLELCVLEDAGKRKWSMVIYTLPRLLGGDATELDIVGMTSRGEVVLSSQCLDDSFPFYLYYYNLESNRFTSFRIQGLEGFTCRIASTFLGYVENLKLM
ncbi:unnamed protein product [Microthlaspi erraticum]|uniref:F-box domain-containing protein n=1 Tax=Microthlaspi erraticum TaxID=1685480 RepID=A0A6D2HCM8_9BRAS|nr:unnamed protein product [Microthlaspi erraticum]